MPEEYITKRDGLFGADGGHIQSVHSGQGGTATGKRQYYGFGCKIVPARNQFEESP